MKTYNYILAEETSLLNEGLNLTAEEFIESLWANCVDDVEQDWEDLKNEPDLEHVIWEDYMLLKYSPYYLVYSWETENNVSKEVEYTSEIRNLIKLQLQNLLND